MLIHVKERNLCQLRVLKSGLGHRSGKHQFFLWCVTVPSWTWRALSSSAADSSSLSQSFSGNDRKKILIIHPLVLKQIGDKKIVLFVLLCKCSKERKISPHIIIPPWGWTVNARQSGSTISVLVLFHYTVIAPLDSTLFFPPPFSFGAWYLVQVWYVLYSGSNQIQPY